MKRIKYIIILLSFAMIFTSSCKKEMMSYEGVEGVYFAVQSGASYGNEKTWPYMPYTNLEFVKVPGNETVVNVKVMITGPVKDYDRKFKVEINPDSTTAQLGVHYDAIQNEIVLPANSYYAYVPVVVHKTPDLLTTVKVIGLRLVENEYFKLSFNHWDAVAGFTSGTVIKEFNASLHSINLSNFLVKPPVWTGSVNAQGQETGYWGDFTRKKFEMMCARFNLTYNDFMSTTTMPTVLQGLIKDVLSRDLIELYNKHTPVLEDDGRLMYLGGCPWTSIIGQPWIP